MTYASITDYNLTGLDIIFVYVNDVTGSLFMKLLLVVIWLVLCIGSFNITKRQTGSGDFSASMTVASFTTFVFAIILKLGGLVDNLSIAVLLGLCVISMGALFFDNN